MFSQRQLLSLMLFCTSRAVQAFRMASVRPSARTSIDQRIILRSAKIVRCRHQSSCRRNIHLFSSSGDDDFANNILGIVIQRASRTLSSKNDFQQTSEDDGASDARVSNEQSVEALVDATIDGASRTLSTTATAPAPDSPNDMKRKPYLGNPAVTPTALAHMQWSHVVRPFQDTVMDATCGNGNDSEALARMLFLSGDEAIDLTATSLSPKLICIDIQKQACETTRQRLAGMLTGDIMDKYVDILECSHAPLPRPLLTESVGLVCYNLGWLPNGEKELYTKMTTTIASIADAVLLVRVGGMISVTTYPRTNRNEDFACRALLEGLALLTSKEVDWREYLDELGPDVLEGVEKEPPTFKVREMVRSALTKIQSDGASKQTWRVMQYKMLGRALSPILLTATRIK